MAKKKPNLNFDFTIINSDDIAKPTLGDVDTGHNIATEVVQQTPFDQDERFSLVKAEQSFTVIKNKLSIMYKNAVALDIKDSDTNTTAMEMLVQCRALIKATDKAKKGIPAYNAAAKFKSGVDTFIREQLKKPIEKIERLINPKIGSYQKAQAELQRRIDQKNAEIERKRVEEETKKAEEIARKAYKKKLEEDAALQKKLNKEADVAGVERVKVDTPEFIEPETIVPSIITPIVKQTEKVMTDQGKATVKSKWICIIINPDKVPRGYCQPNQKSLDAAVEAGARQINGCRIEEKFEPKVRLSSAKKQNMADDNDSFKPL